MAERTNIPTTGTGRELVITRTFDAPRALVWRAWTEPERFMRWWGPKIFTSPSCEMDLRVGGKFLWCMQWPDGRRNYNTGEFLEIVPPERLVYTDCFADEDGNVVPASHYGLPADFPEEMRVTVTFEDLGGKTKMTLTHTGLPAGEMSEMTGQGWNESFDKLAASLR
jgi:uncharacterized protein YndB with AHSA1/START domain